MYALLLSLALGADLPDFGRHYALELTLDPDDRRVDGDAVIRWTNPSQVPLDRLPVHLYLNGFASSISTWMLEDRGLNRGAFGEYSRLRADEDNWGWTTLDSVELQTEGGPVPVTWRFIAPDDGNPNDRTLAELQLPEAVQPGETAELHIRFTSRLPTMGPRSGVADDFILVGHAVPTLAVLLVPEPSEDPETPAQPTWHAHQFHGQVEFFAAFADFDATITAPEGWMLGGTGRLSPHDSAPDDGVWTLSQRAVHDFSWIAARGMVHTWEEHPRPSGGAIRLHFLSPEGRGLTANRVQATVRHGLDFLDRSIGPYPYDDLTVVVPPEAAAGSEAIEFATMFLTAGEAPLLERWPLADLHVIEVVAAHELTHQYFQGLVATDEVEHSWLDEGFTDYWGGRILDDRAAGGPGLGSLLGVDVPTRQLRAPFLSDREQPLRDALWISPTYLYDRGKWNAQVYARMNLILETIDGVFGREAGDRMTRGWFEAGRFRHPFPEDLLQVAHDAGNPEMAAFLREAITRADLPDVQVQAMDTWKREAPLGHSWQGDERVFVHDDTRGDFDAQMAMPFDPDPRDGALTVELTEGGWVGHPASVQLVRLASEGAGEGETLQHSRVRIEGPGWSSLPVEVVLTFEDGMVLRDTWQSASVWREYRVFHTAPIARAEVDPDRKIALDVWPENNGRTLVAVPDRADDWKAWTGALAASLASAAGWWL